MHQYGMRTGKHMQCVMHYQTHTQGPLPQYNTGDTHTTYLSVMHYCMHTTQCLPQYNTLLYYTEYMLHKEEEDYTMVYITTLQDVVTLSLLPYSLWCQLCSLHLYGTHYTLHSITSCIMQPMIYSPQCQCVSS